MRSRKSGDISRLLDVDKSNAALSEQGMARQISGGNALLGLDKYNTGRTADLAGLIAKAGEAQRTNDQAKLTAAYEEFSKATGYPIEVAKLLISANNPAAYGKTETTSAPDNSGWGSSARSAAPR